MLGFIAGCTARDDVQAIASGHEAAFKELIESGVLDESEFVAGPAHRLADQAVTDETASAKKPAPEWSVSVTQKNAGAGVQAETVEEPAGRDLSKERHGRPRNYPLQKRGIVSPQIRPR